MLKLVPERLRSILVLGAHADDIEIGCGGTLLRLLAEHRGLQVHWVVLGAAGGRAEEAARSASHFLAGAASQEVVVKGFRDSYFPYIGGEVKEYMESLRSQVGPDLIFTHRRDDLHQDHRLVAELTWCAFRDHLILEYEVPKYDGDMGQPNLYVHLDAAQCRRKIDAIMQSFPTQRSKPWFTEDTFRALLRLRGVECHSPTNFAEAFFARKMVF
jgi:LmbE family N-acetylglucosaminyl deacetylase